MKKIKLFSLVAAALFAGSTMAQTTTIFDASDPRWSATGVDLTTGATTVGDVTWNGRGSAKIEPGSKKFEDNVEWGARLKFGGKSTFSTSTMTGVFSFDVEKAGTVKVYCQGGGSGNRTTYITQTTTNDINAAIGSFTSANQTIGIATAQVEAGAVYVWADDNVGVYGITFEASAPVTEPWIAFSKEELSLKVTPFVSTAEAELTLKGGNLTAGTYDLSLPTVTGLTITPISVTVADDGTVSRDITLTYTSTVDVSEATIPLSITIDGQTAQLDITYSAVLAVDVNTIFHWQMSGTDAPVAGTALTATGGTIMPSTTVSDKKFGVESAGYVGGVPDDMKAKNEKGVKFGGDALSFKVALADNATFKAGDIVSICGYLPWKISSTSAHSGDLAASVVTGTDKNNYAVGQVVLTADADTLYLMRAKGNSTAVAAIKVERPTECADAEIALPENPDKEVANSALTITAPTLENPNGLVVKYVSSDAEVVAVDENTGALTKGTKTGMATITISWVRQTINTVRHCAGELAYTVTVKDGATEISNAEVYAPAQKVIRDGQLLIIRDGKTYTAQGVELR